MDPSTAPSKNATKRSAVAIVGAGSIGVGWAIVFAQTGHTVRLYDADAARLSVALNELSSKLDELAEFGLLASTKAEVFVRITAATTIATALADTIHVQECAPESLDLKRALFAELDRLSPPDAVLASSTSFIPASRFAADLAGRARCLVVHPANPPYLMRLSEVVPAPFTAEDAVDRTMRLLQSLGMGPVRLGAEIDGFVYNRLQGSLLREAYALVRDGIATAPEIDRIVRDGLGLRWSVLGPFQTADLNTRGGIVAHAKRMGPAYQRMAEAPGRNQPWSADLVAKVATELSGSPGAGTWSEGVARRDRALMALLRERQRRIGEDPAAGTGGQSDAREGQ